MAKLAISNIVKVPVELTINDNGKDKSFKFSLICNRRKQSELDAIQKEEKLIVDVLKDIVIGWEGQTLVVDDMTDLPSEFNAANFGDMLDVKDAPLRFYLAYMNEVGAKTKN